MPCTVKKTFESAPATPATRCSPRSRPTSRPCTIPSQAICAAEQPRRPARDASTAAATAVRSTVGSRPSTVAGRLAPEWEGLIACAARVTPPDLAQGHPHRPVARPPSEVAYYVCQVGPGCRGFGRAVRAPLGDREPEPSRPRRHPSRGRTAASGAKPGIFARFRSFALNILRANGVDNVSEAIYTNALSLDPLSPIGQPKSAELNSPGGAGSGIDKRWGVPRVAKCCLYR